MRSLRSSLLLPFVVLSLAACAGGPTADKGEESPLPIDGALDSQSRPTEHGDLRFGAAATADLSRDARYHAWTFTLTADADLVLRTQPASAGGPEVDTVMYLYREGPRGWGRNIASNDDTGGSLWSSLSRRLVAGRYRVLVKGYSTRTYGAFGLLAECSGDGCGVTRQAECTFGGTFVGIPGTTRFGVGLDAALTASSALTALDAQQIVRALHASSHDDVTTPAAAFARVDGGVINRYRIVDHLGARSFVAFEYGAGDSSYGAIFFDGTATVAAEITDGDLTSCVALRQECVVGVHFADWQEEPRFQPLLDTELRVESTLAALTEQQILIAARVGNSGVADLAAAFATFDEGFVRHQQMRDSELDRSYAIFSYTRGDHRFGAVFEQGTTRVVAEIFDSEHRACTEFTTVSVGEACRGDVDCETGLCLTTEDGPWCWRTYCSAGCRADADCAGFAAVVGVDERSARCEPSRGECWIDGVGAQVCE